MYSLTVYSITKHNYTVEIVDTDLWDNFKLAIIADYDGMTRRSGMPFRYWRSLADDELAKYDAELIDNKGSVEFKSAEQRMAFVLRYS